MKPFQQLNATHLLKYEVVIIGGGSAGIAVASSLLARSPYLDVAIIDPADMHYYQPGWTMVGGGIFKMESTGRPMSEVIPIGAHWIQQAVTSFDPENKQLILKNAQQVEYKALIVCPGVVLNWDAIKGLTATLGKNGVTSNYRQDLAPYTWQLVQELQQGKAIFTQPPMPIKCAGAPQKALYLSSDYWLKNNVLKNIDVSFYNAGAVLFGVKEYVPALMEYMQRYNVDLNFEHKLVKVDGTSQTAWFEVKKDGETRQVSTQFDLLHVVPPQHAPDFIRQSVFADAAGWFEVNPETLQHPCYTNVFGLGDVISASNAKTAAAARKQAPIVAVNVLTYLKGRDDFCHYDGYGSCPLTVERGKIVLAEFGYGGKLLPSFPRWLCDGQQPTKLAWFLKARMLPEIYWKGMLKGREWLVKPKRHVV